MRRGRLRRFAVRLRRRIFPGTSVGEELPLPEEITREFGAEELRDFLVPDLGGTRADPAFQQRLRHELWASLQERDFPDRDERSD